MIFLTDLTMHIPDISLKLIYIWIVAEPIYIALVSYLFITKRKAVYMYFGLLIMQFIWFVINTADRESGFIAIVIYKVIAVTISFAIACLVKYIVYHRKAKKASQDAISKAETNE